MRSCARPCVRVRVWCVSVRQKKDRAAKKVYILLTYSAGEALFYCMCVECERERVCACVRVRVRVCVSVFKKRECCKKEGA